MNLIEPDILKRIDEIGNELAGSSFTRPIARLYSEYTRRREGVKGLPTWNNIERNSRIEDAIILIEAGFTIRDIDYNKASNYFRRAAEFLEWSAFASSADESVTFAYLAAATYQISGHSARALGVLNTFKPRDGFSIILYYYLKGNFLNLHNIILNSLNSLQTDTNELEFSDLYSVQISISTLQSLSIVCSWLRWGVKDRITDALNLLLSINKAMSYSDAPYSWLLSKLVYETSKTFYNTSLQTYFNSPEYIFTKSFRLLIQKYCRNSYHRNRPLVWPSQSEGIKRVLERKSFAICTPTGSGKTRIAEFAILESLFQNNQLETINFKPVVLYLVPLRVLASEVEKNISYLFRELGINNVVITSMYGGADWGPSDAIANFEGATVIVSTHEKAETLLRFIGKNIIERISAIVLDEAHSISFDGDHDKLLNFENRGLSLEGFLARLFALIKRDNIRFIALSAVAGELDKYLANWAECTQNGSAIRTNYRSTRQLLGRLLCFPDGSTRIEYDLLDGKQLVLQDSENDEHPYIPRPFPSIPITNIQIELESKNAETQMRQHLLWAAIHLAAKTTLKDNFHCVLISVAEHPEFYAKTFLELIEAWNKVIVLPTFFELNKEITDSTYDSCLSSCEDYFGKESYEYRLLKKGIILHHGKMPHTMSILLIRLIQNNVINIVLSTSTLSEGVNLPFETILIPTICRGRDNFFSAKEFGNLIGRAGRPGIATEGRALVLFNPNSDDYKQKLAIQHYKNIVVQLSNNSEKQQDTQLAIKAPLEQLIRYILFKWNKISNSQSIEEFTDWLEKAAIGNPESSYIEAETAIDTLDGILLSGVQEYEITNNSLVGLEIHLKKIWAQSFSSFALPHDKFFQTFFCKRGIALAEKHYPEFKERQRLYKIGLPPRHGKLIVQNLDDIYKLLSSGKDYVLWNDSQKYDYIVSLVDLVKTIKPFSFNNMKVGRNEVPWQSILKWWLLPNQFDGHPSAGTISRWYSYTAKNFVYKFAWGIGSIVGAILPDISGNENTLERWQLSGLPWAPIWIKDLITWGVVDPVASCILARRLTITRQSAKKMASKYWDSHFTNIDDTLLNPKEITKWVIGEMSGSTSDGSIEIELPIINDCVSFYSQDDFKEQKVHIIPIDAGNKLTWYDVAGYRIADSKRPKTWNNEFSSSFDFIYDVQDKLIRVDNV